MCCAGAHDRPGRMLRPGDKVQAGGSANAGVCLLLGPRASAKRAAQGSDNLCTRLSAAMEASEAKLLHKVNQRKMEQSMECGVRTALADLMRN